MSHGDEERIAWVTTTTRHRVIVDPEDEANRAIDRLESALDEWLGLNDEPPSTLPQLQRKS